MWNIGIFYGNRLVLQACSGGTGVFHVNIMYGS